MKKNLLVLFLSTLAWLPVSAVATERFNVSVDFQNGFDGEAVELVINGETAYASKRVVTNRILGLAAHAERKVGAGTCDIVLIVNGVRAFSQKLVVERDMFLAFGLLGGKSPYLSIYLERLTYE